MKKIYHVKMLSAIRIIGICNMIILGFITSLFSIKYISSKTEIDFYIFIQYLNPFGSIWLHLFITSNSTNIAIFPMYIYFFFATLFSIANMYLIIAPYFRKSTYTIPWLIIQTISIINQSISFVLSFVQNLSRTEPPFFIYSEIWFFPMSGLYLIFSIYSWSTVNDTRKKWIKEQSNHRRFFTVNNTNDINDES
ncbi:uncharacterized protein LOC102678561 [Apis dorsata]|uniref:uncharacterized protein LOC102678561 n=1 Tax=Apis dorsata TaxID=7462 RepID=UPI0012930087|nr:uncharacterized protein LOC102678561 [Apis dorsata]